MLLLMAVAGLPAMFLAMRLVGSAVRDTAGAPSKPILCLALLAVALTIALGATESLAPVVSLLILVCVGLLVFGGAVAVFARSVITPMWVSVRETRS
jgi:hypothetical protein